MTKRVVFCVSDHTGLTAETYAHSIVSRFRGVEATYETRPFVDDHEKLTDVVAEIDSIAREGPRPIVFSTLTDPEMSRVLSTANGLVLGLFDGFVEQLSAELGQEAATTVGMYHGIGDVGSYQVRMDALDFTLTTDDGLGMDRYQLADIIVIGASRVGKTPTCLYLSMQYGLRAANYPLTGEELESSELPQALQPYRDRLFGLTIDPTRLYQIRQKRRPDSSYSSFEQCTSEVAGAERMFRAQSISTIDTTTRSIEEITATLMREADLDRKL